MSVEIKIPDSNAYDQQFKIENATATLKEKDPAASKVKPIPAIRSLVSSSYGLNLEPETQNHSGVIRRQKYQVFLQALQGKTIQKLRKDLELKATLESNQYQRFERK